MTIKASSVPTPSEMSTVTLLPGLPIAQMAKLGSAGREAAFIFYSGRPREELERLVRETGAAGAIDKASGPTGLARQFSEIVEKL